MGYKLAIKHKNNYLHAVVTGPNSIENVKGYLEEILGTCLARNCFRVLIEERLEGPRLGTMDVFMIVAEESGKARGTIKELAYVDTNAKGDLMQFAETVASNRGMRVAVFPTVAEAESWLVTGNRKNSKPGSAGNA